MSRGINKVILIGNLGADPDGKIMSNGQSVTNISLATSESWKDKNTGDLQERTEWHRVVFYRALADVVYQYLRKGSKIYVEGKIQTRKWQDREGQDRWTTEIVAREMQMLDSRRRDGDTNKPATTASGRATTGSTRDYQAPAEPGFDDDVPF